MGKASENKIQREHPNLVLAVCSGVSFFMAWFGGATTLPVLAAGLPVVLATINLPFPVLSAARKVNTTSVHFKLA